MRSNYLKATLKTVFFGMIVLLCTTTAFAQITVNLTTTRQTALMPDGTTVPMWGWFCVNPTITSTALANGGTCSTLTGAVQAGGAVWQPPLITVPTGQSLTINLTNNLPMETSLTIIGQLGGGLGSPVREAGPRLHPPQTTTTWTIQTTPAVPFTSPSQGARARSFVPEAPPNTGTQTYSWGGTGQPALKPGTYLIETGTYPSIQGPMGLYGVLVVTTAPVAGTSAGTAYSGTAALAASSSTGYSSAPYSIQYDADVPLLLSEIDPVQNRSVEHVAEVEATCPTNTGLCSGTIPATVETAKWNLTCAASTTAGSTCLPPAVDYTPLFFLINGQSFDKTSGASTTFGVPGTASTGNVLLRIVNAGVRMHVPSVDGLPMSLIAEDGNVLSDIALQAAKDVGSTHLTTYNARTQNEVFLPAGKVYDVVVQPTETSATAYTPSQFAVFDRQLSLSGNGFQHDTGMRAVVLVANGVGGGGVVSGAVSKAANPDSYIVPAGATTFTANVLANDVGINAASSPCSGTPTTVTLTTTYGSVVLNPNGSFTYTTTGLGSGVTDSFTYCGDALYTATVTLTGATIGGTPVANNDRYTSKVSTLIKINAPGVLANDTDPTGYPLTALAATNATGGTVMLNPDGGFTATLASPCTAAAGCLLTFQYNVTNSQRTSSTTPATVTVTFLPGNGFTFTVKDARTGTQITDYKWIIEQDLTFHIDPACQQNGPGGSKPATCPTGRVPYLGTNFHTSYMPVIAVGCTGAQSCERDQTVYDPVTKTHVPAVCDGSGICTPVSQLPAGSNPWLAQSTPDQVNLPSTDQFGRPAYYYLSILPGDVSNAFNTGNVSDPTVAGNCTHGTTPTGESVSSICGHTMGGAPIAPGQTTVTVVVEPNPLPTATVTVYVFQDDYPLNGEPDAGGGPGGNTLDTNEPPLGDFQVELWDDAGGSGDATGQMTYDMFNEPLTNSLNGTIDPNTGLNACPIANTAAADPTNNSPSTPAGTIIVCPRFESDGTTLSPLTGQAVIKNLMPGRFGIIVHPGAAREARGEEWLQTNTLDGTHFLDSFVKSGEPAYFQEYGPGGFHVFMGMANPAVINGRLASLCNGPGAPKCNNTVKGQVTNLHQSRSPNESLYDSGVFPQGNAGNYAPLAYTSCYVSLGDTDGATLALTKCDPNGNFTFTGIPDGNWGLVAFDQWLDLIVDGSSRSVSVKGGQTINIDYPAFTWQTHLWSRTYMDIGGLGAPVLLPDGTLDPAKSPGLIQVPTRVRMRNGKFNNSTLTDIGGNSDFNETFPLFNWYVVETDNTRFRPTGVHVVNDAGGQLDGPGGTGCLSATAAGGVCGNGHTGPYQGVLSSVETISVPTAQRVPGAVYCVPTDAQCAATNFSTNPAGGGSGGSTGRIDPGAVVMEGWQGGLSEYNIIDWGKQPYVAGETGGIRGHVVYNSTRPFDDPSQLFQNLWEPLVPGVTVNLYQERTAPDGTISLKLVDTTTASSWDAWAQGFRADGVTPNMNCPGQDAADPFFAYTMAGSPYYLNPNTPLPNNSQYKCFDGYHNLNQVQPAPYDGLYQFPSATCSTTPGATFSVTVNGVTETITCATVANPALLAANASPHTGAAPAVLPAGKYVVEEITPPGYELVKEEDKNILIGDQFIAPVTQQFGGIGNIWILPDQASMSSYNSCYGTGGGCTNPTTDLGHPTPSTFGPGGLITSTAPCVGALRIVPDFMSISPESGEVAPFAGASRHLCDRKEVTLEDQMQAQTDFFIWTKTPAAAHYAGFITDDFSSEFDPASPAFGEKFAVPNVPVSIRDFNGVETSRVYSDAWGTFNGLTFSTFDVDPPNPTGYAPGMLITCMNDPGPIPGPNGTMITDPLFNPAYSDFCYENPFMPQDTDYLDTPVVPVSAFAEAYNPPDCAYPDFTPAVKEVDGDGIGPWVGATGARKLTITALGDQIVLNHAYSGPAATTAPYNQKFVTRHYGFGSTQGTVTVGGLALTGVTWSDTTITGTVPANLSLCPIRQRNLPAGTTPARCGELVITTPPSTGYPQGQQSIDTVTVTVGGKAPTRLAPGTTITPAQTIQSAIDAATPGDLIIIPAGTYNEMLLMWKPVRLQGVGAASSVVNANTHPAGKLLEPWRREVNCLFGLTLSGGVIGATNPVTGQPNPYDPSGAYSCPSNMQGAIDPIPLEGIVGWDASLNGNLAELLQEPTLMGAYEGAAITVLGKGVRVPPGTANEGGFPVGTVLLTNSTGDCNDFPSNFLCNPSRIDGISFTNSSQGGGGVFVHGWNHNLEIANNRVTGNSGTLTGGVTVGIPEVPDAENGRPDGSSLIDANGTEQPYLFNTNVHMHNNSVTLNASFGDELGSNTPASAGGVVFCSGDDYYQFSYNWVCGNMSTGDGGGMAHFGFSWNGDIEHNSFLFNQSFNPTLTTYGGGLIVEGPLPDGTVCENAGDTAPDMDCPPDLSDGIGPGLVINANLFQGNTAESGSGGGLRLHHVNGTDVQRNPSNGNAWYQVSVTNNIIANNVAGWAGAGVSLLDAVRVNFINNTVVSNDVTASAGVLFDTLGAPSGTVAPPGCNPNTGAGCTNPVTTSNFQPSGLETEHHSLLLSAAFTAPVNCPAGHPQCTTFSNPVLDNNLFWQNRAFHITVGAPPLPVVQLVPALTQTTTGACPSGATYWDIGTYGDSGPTSHGSGLTLNPLYSMFSAGQGYAGTNISPSSSGVVKQYCNGSRVPPEIAPQLCSGANGNANAPGCIQPGTVGVGQTVPVGTPDNNPPNPAFTLTPAATVDEGNNWINMFYGPLSSSNATIASGSTGYNVPLGNYALAAGSPAIDVIPRVGAGTTFGLAPSIDFFGNPRPDPANPNAVDIGAVEFAATGGAAIASVTGGPLAFGNVAVGTTSTSRTLTLHNTGTTALTGIALTFTGPFARATAGGTCGATLSAASACTINVAFQPAGAGAVTGSVAIAASVSVAGSPVILTGTGVAAVVSASLTPTTRNFGGVTRGSLTGPVQVFTLTNTGNVTLTSIAQGALGGANSTEFFIIRLMSTCGPAGGGQLLGQTTLAPGAACVVTVQFRPLTTQTTGIKNATLSVTNAAGTQTSTLSGTAN